MTPPPPHTPHDGYITAVHTHLETENLRVLERHTTHSPLRRAQLRLDPDQDDNAFTDLAGISLHWQEDLGWWISLTHQPATGLRPTPLYRGTSLVPAPEVITAWVRMLLTQPDMLTTTSGNRLRRPTDPAPALETQLADYPTGRDEVGDG